MHDDEVGTERFRAHSPLYISSAFFRSERHSRHFKGIFVGKLPFVFRFFNGVRGLEGCLPGHRVPHHPLVADSPSASFPPINKFGRVGGHVRATTVSSLFLRFQERFIRFATSDSSCPLRIRSPLFVTNIAHLHRDAFDSRF